MIDALIRKNIREIQPYSSARDEFHGDALVFLDANENAFGSSADVVCNRYPDPYQREIKKRISSLKGVAEENIFIGHGSDEVIDLLIRACCEPTSEKVLITPPTYGMYAVSAAVSAVEVVEVPLDERFQPRVKEILAADAVKIIFLCSPNNPTGNCLEKNLIRDLLRDANALVVVDEAYIDFCPSSTCLDLLNEFENLVVIQTLSKAWGLAGLRLGMAFGNPRLVEVLSSIKPPYNISTATQEIVQRALASTEFLDRCVREIVAEREKLTQALRQYPFVTQVYPSDANFLLVQTSDAVGLYTFLLEKGIVIRQRSNLIGCEGCVRITVGTPEENRKLIAAFDAFALGGA